MEWKRYCIFQYKRSIFTGLITFVVIQFLQRVPMPDYSLKHLPQSNKHEDVYSISESTNGTEFSTPSFQKSTIRRYSSATNLETNKSELKIRLKTALNRAAYNEKVILYLNDYLDYQNERTLGWECGSCDIRFNHSMIADEAVAAVVFKFATVKKYMPISSLRRRDQLYVCQSGESPAALNIYRGMKFYYEDRIGFNVTMTFRRDSDVYAPYGKLNYISNRNITRIINSKTRLSVAVVSNCELLPGSRSRYHYLLKLKNKLNVDLFGKCFSSREIPKRSKREFLRWLAKYKFYFAFENSYHCRDYITEKFFRNALLSNTVPIVWGAERRDYEAVAPPGSFIFVEDFTSIDDLVKHLNYLDSNDTAYAEYLKWRETLKKVSRDEAYFNEQATGNCRLCRIVHGINIDDIYHPNYNETLQHRPMFSSTVSNRIVPSLRQWFMEDNKECFHRAITIL